MLAFIAVLSETVKRAEIRRSALKCRYKQCVLAKEGSSSSPKGALKKREGEKDKQLKSDLLLLPLLTCGGSV